MDIDVKGALAMGRENFIASHLKFRSIKDMGENRIKYLNKLYDEFERVERKDTEDKPAKVVSRVRKRQSK